MKSLYILRHAKSDWKAPYGTDHDRPLNGRGRRAAATLGEHLERLGEAPDKVLLSSAKRTRQTLELAMEAGGWNPAAKPLDELYDASTAQASQCIQTHGGSASRLLIVGHQPTVSSLVYSLTGESASMVTAALVRIDLGIDSWTDLGPRTGELVWIVNPRDLEE